METLMLRDLLPAIGGVALGAVRLLRLVLRRARNSTLSAGGPSS
jgi:hypothetical protein